MSGPKLIIKRQISPIWKLFWLLFFLGLLAVSFFVGRHFAFEERQQILDKTAWLQKKLDENQYAFQKANEDLIMQTQSSKVDNQSNQQLVDSIKKLQNTQRELEAELKFYRNIMAPELAQDGLTIAEFELSKNELTQGVIFKLVLTQAGKQEQFMKGEVTLMLHGTINDQSTDFNFRDLGTFKSSDFKFQFKYFQNLEGEIELPKEFVAEQVSILAKTAGLRKNQTAEKRIDWNI